MAKVATAEPTMDELLASIRRIISNDAGVDPAPLPETAERAPEPPVDPLQPLHLVGAPLARAAVPAKAEPFGVVEPEPFGMTKAEPFGMAKPEPVVSEAPAGDIEIADLAAIADDAIAAAPEADDGPLVSGETETLVGLAFDDLARAVVESHARHFDATVREMLRPMLADWLDAHLGPMVEKLVRAEIERLSRSR